ncbi:MAG: hypothetical protein FWD57_09175, partial [Polyangiaceae bacterium]|nr:hypothetical protein [Polyangiaceae bacterium]
MAMGRYDSVEFLRVKKAQVVKQLGELLPGVGSVAPEQWLMDLRWSDGLVGFRDQGKCSGNGIIPLPGPKESNRRAHFHIEEQYSVAPPHDLVFYRYEICWQFDCLGADQRADYLREYYFTLRRGVRFDHHPKVGGSDHPKYHWHPNGCSEFRLSTCMMTPLKTAIVATMMFDRK